MLLSSQALAQTAEATEQSETRNAVALAPVTVHGEATSVNDTYAGGQVTYSNRAGFLGNRDFMETPFNAISYTDRFIQDQQAQNIADVIAATDPSVFSNGVTSAWSENYSIRGFNSSTTDTTFDSLAGMAPYYRTSPEMFERIEVLKGPSALLNGMPPGGSVGGAINLVPKRAGDEPLTRFTTTYMSDAQFGGHLDVGRRVGDNQQFGIRFNGVYRDGEGAVNNQKPSVQMGALGLDWRGERARLSADLYSADDHIDGPTRGVNLTPGLAVPTPPDSDTLINPDWAFANTRDKGAIVRGEFDFTDEIMGYASVGRSETNYTYNGAMSSLVLDDQGNYRTSIGQLAFDVEKTSAEVGVRGHFQTGAVSHAISVNATHYEHEQHDYGRRTVPGADWVTNLYDPQWGAAAEFITPHIMHTELRLNSYGLADTISFADDRLQLTLGARRQEVVSDAYSVTSGARISRYDESAVTPAAALLFRATDQVSLYANYIEGLSQGATAPMSAANAGEVFEPYKTKQNEIGVKFDLGDFSHTLSLYEIKRPSSYTDLETNIFSFGGEQRNRGAEWNFFGSPLSNLRLMGGIAYVDPKVTRAASDENQGSQATGVPDLQAKLGAEWDLSAAPGLTLTANATAMSEQYINSDNSLSVPGHTIYDVGARYTTHLSGYPLTLRATIDNVTDKAYWAMPQLSSLALGAPRTFMFSASLDF
ncbi:MAG TPA: TonB-dependent siderophore receptor [Halomonas sp.]|uniref:TonB-dependent siderophore receptor n=1 Tax=Halomonas campaniensis TaxID=213554 RepID=A0A3D0KAY1_9GAMM|nr:TonB-dependent siderophore receptor [Halomonas sp.]HBS81766.1 TonB-dependent siderophore receptor [Halomonas campaniensis]HCA00707.1 TonB-dependent siderophore receptor [Halomonas campaniensis]